MKGGSRSSFSSPYEIEERERERKRVTGVEEEVDARWIAGTGTLAFKTVRKSPADLSMFARMRTVRRVKSFPRKPIQPSSAARRKTPFLAAPIDRPDGEFFTISDLDRLRLLFPGV